MSKLKVDDRIVDLFMKFGGKSEEEILAELERQAQYPDSKVFQSTWPELACQIIKATKSKQLEKLCKKVKDFHNQIAV